MLRRDKECVRGDLRLTLFVVASLTMLSITLARRSNRRSSSNKFPPGPPRKPIVGNLFDADPNFPFLTYTEWGRIYGDMVYSRFLDQNVVILNSETACKDLLDKRSSIYSDRIDTSGLEPYGWNWAVVTLRYGDRWRRARRIFHQSFRSEVASVYRPIQVEKAKQLLANISRDPANFMSHIKLYAASTSMSVVYGYETNDSNDKIIAMIENGIEYSLKMLSSQRATVLRYFPWVLRLPVWFPGGWMRREAEESRRVSVEMVDIPYQLSNAALNSSPSPTPLSSLVSDNIGKLGDKRQPDHEEDLKYACSSAYAAGVESTAATIQFLILAMVLYPHVQDRAYREITSIVGCDRLPDFNDRSSLPYVEAVVREVLRWQPTFPLAAFPHASTEDDVYRGYFIPKGTMVIANTWAITRSQSLYTNPSEFRPERFLDGNGRLNDDDPGRYVFGWGRRICPGRYVADASVWVAIAQILATFRVERAKDKNGQEVQFEPTFTTSMSRHPNPFPCTFVPRSAE